MLRPRLAAHVLQRDSANTGAETLGTSDEAHQQGGRVVIFGL